jgi:hypothetical protein
MASKIEYSLNVELRKINNAKRFAEISLEKHEHKIGKEVVNEIEQGENYYCKIKVGLDGKGRIQVFPTIQRR